MWHFLCESESFFRLALRCVTKQKLLGCVLVSEWIFFSFKSGLLICTFSFLKKLLTDKFFKNQFIQTKID